MAGPDQSRAERGVENTPSDGVVALVALGGNRPWKDLSSAQVMAAATRRLRTLGWVEACSGVWRTDAWPDPTRPEYINLCVRLRTELGPEALLAALLAIETEFGRVRGEPNADRTLDLDLLDYGGRVIGAAGDALVTPHPRLHLRAFALLPLRDVAPDWRHPATGETVEALLAALGPSALEAARRVSPG